MAKGKVVGQIDVIMTSKGVKLVAKDLEKVSKTTKEVEKSQKKQTETQKKSTKVAKDYDKQNKSVYQGNLSSAKSFSKMNQSIGSDSGSSGLVGAYATLAANVFAATAAFNALRAASQVQQLEKGLEVLGRSAGKNLTVMADGFREAAGFAVSYDQALRAISVGSSAAFSGTQIEGLAEVAKAAATALGRDVGDAVDRLTRGAAKLEPEILDELGIFVRLDDASAKYAASLGVAASELTRFQQRQAFANEILEQGRRKFGQVGQEVEASSFDKLAASLADLSRSLLDFFNKVLGPVASFFSQNTIALAGFFAMITKGIMNQALPMLNQFAATAQKGAQEEVRRAQAAARRIDKEIKAQRGLMQPLKMVKGEYGALFEKIKAGTATVKEQEIAHKKLQLTIQKRQANILKGGLKNLALKQKELAAIEVEEQALKDLMKLEKQRAGKMGDIRTLSAGAKSKRSTQAVFRELDKDQSFKGYMRAFGLSNLAQKKYRKNLGDSVNSGRLFGMNLGFIGKAANRARPAIFGFGLTTKIAIKGIFTAIPVIGQFLFALDLLIVGLKKTIGFLGGLIPEASALSKAMKELSSITESFAEQNSKSNLENKNAAQSLIIAANSTNQLMEATKKASEAQAEAFKNANNFGKALLIIKRRASEVADSIGRGFGTALDYIDMLFLMVERRMLKTINSPIIKAFMNVYTALFNAMFAKEGEELEYQGLFDNTKLKKETDRINGEIAEIEARRDALLDKSNLSGSLFNLSSTMPEVQAFEELMYGAGAATTELKDFLGGADVTINSFLQSMGEASSLGDLPEGLQLLAKELDKTGKPTERATALNKMFEDGVLDTAEAQQLLQIAMDAGTATTVTAGKSAEELGQQFQNSGEKINEFFTSFRKKAAVGPMLSELKAMQVEVASLAKGEDGFRGIFDQFELAPASLRAVVDNTENIQAATKKLNAELAKQEPNQELILQLQSQIGEARQTELGSLEKLTRELYKQQLFDQAKLKSLGQQDKALKKFSKVNSAATQFQIEKANAQQQITDKRLKNELELAEKSLTLKSKEAIAAGNIDELSTEQLEIYAAIQDKKQEIAENDEKSIQAGEKAALIAQQTLALTRLQNAATIAEANAQLKVTKALQAQANAARGLGRGQTSGQQLTAQKESAKIARDQAQFEVNNLEKKLELELTILKARLKAAGVSKTEIENIEKMFNLQAKAQKDAAGSKLKGAQSDLDQVGNDRFTGLLGDTAGFKSLSAIDTASTELATIDGAGTQDKMEALMESTAPMREALMALGPEGEAVATAQAGIVSLVAAFDVITNSGAATEDRLAAVGAAIGTMGQIMAANSRAQIAEIDGQIEAEKKRDGKSADSLNKIKAMEKKKEEMERKMFERNKKMQMAQTVMNTASSIMGVLSGIKDPLVTAPLAVAQAAMFAVMGAAQLAIISKQQFQGGSTNIEKPQTNLQVGKRSNAVNVANQATGGELNYLRGGSTTGQNLGGAGGSFPGGAMGRRGYANGGDGIMVGERGPEIITPAAPVDITPNFALGGAGSNVNFTINAVDAAGVEDVLMNQRGNIIRMIREAANENGTMFLEEIDTQAYGSSS